MRTLQTIPGEAIAIADDGTTSSARASAGLVRISPAEFDKAAQDPPISRLQVGDSSQGLAGLPARTAIRTIRGRDGRLWFVTGNGLTLVDPRRLSADQPPPRVLIERIEADGRQFDTYSPIALTPRTTALQLTYTAPTFRSPTNVQFRYRLDGFDEGRIDAGTRRQAFYTNLPPGRYRFRVAARGAESGWSPREAAVDFSIRPMFYQTTWFLALVGLAFVLSLLASRQLKLRQVRRQFAMVLAERVRLGREIHDTLLQSLVGMALEVNTVSQKLDSSPANAGVKEQLGRLRRQVERNIREARESIWALRSTTFEGPAPAAAKEAGQRAASGTPVEFEIVEGGPSSGRCPPRIEERALRIGRKAIQRGPPCPSPGARRLHYGTKLAPPRDIRRWLRVRRERAS